MVNPEVYFIEEKDAGKRLDVFLATVTGLTRSQIGKIIDQAQVKVNDKVVTKAGYKLKLQEKVAFIPPLLQALELTPEPIPLDILYEDEHLIVVNKSPGLVVHPAPGHFQGTLVHALLYHCPNLSGIGGVKRPGIVHRLDKDTSGVLVVAKDDQTHQGLSHQFKERVVKKQYLALVFGIPTRSQGKIDFSLGRHPKDRKKISIRTKKPRIAVTLWQLKEEFSSASLLLCEPKTGRTHQIRVHLAVIGHPILGDPIYFRKSKLNQIKSKSLRTLLWQVPRLMLHAWRLEFMHPVTQKNMTFEAPLPSDMVTFIQQLRSQKENHA
ncbi:MAG: RluA family pseudouridine synthase [Candidatus Desulfofervidaceae bacterium]|nr:RluA family pseudouridine synthase [Candidatus Desulfofervidaceae bacterium]